MKSRFSKGGLEPRYIVERVDGKPIPKEARFPLVLDISGRDPHARVAVAAYAASVERDNPLLAADLRKALDEPEEAQAQHKYA